MKLFALVAVTMTAFAANSVLNRAAVGDGGMGAMDFAALRLWAGAAILAILAFALRGGMRLRGRGRLGGLFGLVLYLVGFSWAYQALDAGLGALVLFGTVQITMFAGSLWAGERPPARRWIGAALALGGLAWLLWPTDAAPTSLAHGLSMAAAGFGWGVYSLAGRMGDDPLADTAANFVLAAPLAVVLFAVPGGVNPADWTAVGLALAVASGAIASGIGYALWYGVLPHLAGSTAAVAQLTVPLIAMAGGMVFLSEPLTSQFLVAAAIVLAGVALSVLPFGRR